MKIKLALGVIASLTAMTLNTMPTGNDTKIVIENEITYESNESIEEIKDEIEDESVESDTSIPEESESKIKPIKTPIKTPTKNQPKNKSSNAENHTENKLETVNPDSNPPQGKVYVEGFGYVEDSGPAQGKTVHSDGDINKMVGTME